jgi:hypothetical protein
MYLIRHRIFMLFEMLAIWLLSDILIRSEIYTSTLIVPIFYQKLPSELGVTMDDIRTALNHLISNNYIQYDNNDIILTELGEYYLYKKYSPEERENMTKELKNELERRQINIEEINVSSESEFDLTSKKMEHIADSIFEESAIRTNILVWKKLYNYDKIGSIRDIIIGTLWAKYRKQTDVFFESKENKDDVYLTKLLLKSQHIFLNRLLEFTTKIQTLIFEHERLHPDSNEQ